MKNVFVLSIITILLFFIYSCASGNKNIVSSNIISLEQALKMASNEFGSSINDKSIIAVVGIETPLESIKDFLIDELNTFLVRNGRFSVVARDKISLAALNEEHNFQMSGMVSDESAVGIGHYLGAKLVITGTFNHYADFNQLRLRILDVNTAQILDIFTAFIKPDDVMLASLMQPLDKPPIIKENVIVHLNRGEDFLREGKYDDAIAQLDTAISLDRNLFDCYFYRALAYNKKGDINRAIEDFTQAIKLNPDEVSAYFNRALAYEKKGEFNRAIGDYTQIIRIKPNHFAAFFYRGFIYYLKNDFDRAIADYTQSININPYQVEAYTNRALLYSDIGDFDKAMIDLNQAIMNNPNRVEPYINRGMVHSQKGNIERAIADFTQAININPYYGDSYFNRGISYLDIGDYNKAILDFEAVLRINPDNDAAKFNLYKARRLRGN